MLGILLYLDSTLHKSPYSVQIQENTEQKKRRSWTRSASTFP